MTRNFPLPKPATDARFTFGLTHDIARRITGQGYPELTGRDFVELQQALFGFLYAHESADVADAACPECKGSGTVEYCADVCQCGPTTCTTCNGTGRVIA